jgi:hypothetical protein
MCARNARITTTREVADELLRMAKEYQAQAAEMGDFPEIGDEVAQPPTLVVRDLIWLSPSVLRPRSRTKRRPATSRAALVVRTVASRLNFPTHRHSLSPWCRKKADAAATNSDDPNTEGERRPHCQHRSGRRLRQLFARRWRRETVGEQPLVQTVAKMAVWDEAQSSYAETATSLQHCDPARRYRKAGAVHQRTALKSGRQRSVSTVCLSPGQSGASDPL